MSVRKTDRSLSGIEFLDNAVKIYKLTFKICMKMPKRYTYLINITTNIISFWRNYGLC